MINYYIYAALARERSNFLQREAAAARRADQARLYRQRARASGARRSPSHRLFGRLRPAWPGWPDRTRGSAG